jgi:DNA-binding FadR family transcriptional regulator
MTTARQGRLPQHRIAEIVASELRARILAADGDYRLPTQDQLVSDFGVSYPSVREAIRILETEGLVTVRRGNVGGAEVHRPNQSSAAYHLGLALQSRQVTLGDLAASLQLLEPLCTAECAKRPDRATVVIPALEANIAESADLISDGVAFTRVAREFHDLLVSFTPNATIQHLMGTLVTLWSAQEQTWAEAMTQRGEYPSPQEAARAVSTHRHIAEKIAAGNTAEAEHCARAHLIATQKLVLERFEEGIVNVSSVQARQAIASNRPVRTLIIPTGTIRACSAAPADANTAASRASAASAGDGLLS